MTPHQTVALSVRIFAIWLPFYFGRDIYSFYFAPDTSGRAGALTLALVAFFVACVASALLWAFPLTVARNLLPPVASEPAPPAVPEAWLAAGCTLLGLWVLSSAGPLLFRDFLVQHLYVGEYGGPGVNPYIIRYVAELAVAIWLICGARGIAAIYRWGRSAGTSKSSN